MELNDLRKTAEAATPGPWEAKPYLYGVDDDGRIRVTSPSDRDSYNLAENVLPNDATHISTFDPPTVLALLSRLEQAEQQRDSSREACKTLAEVLSNHSEWIVEATDSQDLIGEDGDGDWDVVWDRVMELGEAKRKAEQAVARVREFSDQMLKPHGQNVVVAARVRERLAEILDGDGRG